MATPYCRSFVVVTRRITAAPHHPDDGDDQRQTAEAAEGSACGFPGSRRAEPPPNDNADRQTCDDDQQRRQDPHHLLASEREHPYRGSRGEGCCDDPRQPRSPHRGVDGEEYRSDQEQCERGIPTIPSGPGSPGVKVDWIECERHIDRDRHDEASGHDPDAQRHCGGGQEVRELLADLKRHTGPVHGRDEGRVGRPLQQGVLVERAEPATLREGRGGTQIQAIVHEPSTMGERAL